MVSSRVALGHVCYRYTWKTLGLIHGLLPNIVTAPAGPGVDNAATENLLTAVPSFFHPKVKLVARARRPAPRAMWLLLPYSGSASLEARPTTLNSIKDAGTSSRWVHAVQTTDSSNSLEVFVPPGRRIVTPAGARTIHSAPSQ